MTQAKITITRTRRGLGFPDTQRYVKRAAAAALRAEGVTVPCELDVTLTDDPSSTPSTASSAAWTARRTCCRFR